MLEVNKMNTILVNYIMCNQEIKHRNKTVRFCHKMFQNKVLETKRMVGNPNKGDPFKHAFLNILLIILLSLAHSRPMSSVTYLTMKGRPSLKYSNLSFNIIEH